MNFKDHKGVRKTDMDIFRKARSGGVVLQRVYCLTYSLLKMRRFFPAGPEGIHGRGFSDITDLLPNFLIG